MKLSLMLLTLTLFPLVSACQRDEYTLGWVHYYATRFGLDPYLFEAVIRHESSLCLDAVSKEGAIGLGQLMPATAIDLGVNPHAPLENLYGAAFYLRQQYETFQSWELALAAYNAGPEAVRVYDGVPPFKETQTFVKEVLTTYESLAFSP
jgi:soluble lytic murein transglycosylase-like protein